MSCSVDTARACSKAAGIDGGAIYQVILAVERLEPFKLGGMRFHRLFALE
jgi:hypothetical protein